VLDLTDFQRQLLLALVEGYEARAGMKDRIRALNEWEIARRSGYTEISYAQYLEHPARDVVMEGLMALQRFGLVDIWERGVKYDTFVPTASGTAAAGLGDRGQVTGDKDDAIIERLDQIIRLLKSVEAKLGGS
jgi:hypothetical protein